MNISTNKKVEAFLNDIQFSSAHFYEMVLAIRKLFFSASRDLSEDIKYGGLVFIKSDALIGGVFAYKKHISIEFGEGAGFTDPDCLLEGGGKHRRHLKIYSIDDIGKKKCRYYIDQAIKGRENI